MSEEAHPLCSWGGSKNTGNAFIQEFLRTSGITSLMLPDLSLHYSHASEWGSRKEADTVAGLWNLPRCSVTWDLHLESESSSHWKLCELWLYTVKVHTYFKILQLNYSVVVLTQCCMCVLRISSGWNMFRGLFVTLSENRTSQIKRENH